MLAMIEGFDYYPADLSMPGIGLRSSWIANNCSPSLVGGRFEAKAMIVYGAGAGQGFATRVVPTTNNGKFGIGFAIRPDPVAGFIAGNGDRIFSLTTPLDSGAHVLTFAINDVGQLTLWSGDVGQNLYGLCPRSLLGNTWSYVEVEMDIASGVGGRVKCMIDGEVQFDLTGINTNPYGRDQVGRWVNRVRDGARVVLDDMYWIIDESVTLGESRIQVLEANADVDVEWTGSPDAGNFANIDDTSTDGDSTYNFTNTVGAIDLFGTSDIAVNPDKIHAVGIIMAARKEDSGTRTIRGKIRSGSDDGDGPNYNLTTDYTWTRQLFLTDPQGDVEWIKARVNALNIGYELVL